METVTNVTWRDSILHQLQTRNKQQTSCFVDLIAQNNRLFDVANALRSENIHLTVQIEKLRSENVGTAGCDSKLVERVQYLEQKLLVQQEELTELHRRKGENAQQIIDLNAKLQECERQLVSKEVSLVESTAVIVGLKSEVSRYEMSLSELEKLNQMLRDEHQALQMAFAALEEKLRKAQDENRQLVERLIHYKAKDAEKMNEENDNFLKRKHAKMQKELEEACRDTRGLSPEPESHGPVYRAVLPEKAALKFDAHEGEVNAVMWSPADKLLATGGADRKVKLWDISKGNADNKGVLIGSNAGVMSVDFDSTGCLVLGASNDYASRVWTVADQRLRHTLTGHSGKVMAAKFLGEASRVVTGSHDRTLKIWDLRSIACIETKFAGSSCNDLVSVDSSGSTIISGHFDKTIRFWDTRSESSRNNIPVNGKVTSLDLSRDANYLISCVRDDTLKLIDLRMNQIVRSFSSEGFKVGCDWSRVSFSPDGQYVAVGSSDGNVYIWGVATAKLEAVLKAHTSAVTATVWHPHGNILASVDRTKKTVIWGEL